MNTGTRLAAYGGVLAVVFGGGLALGHVAVPDSAVQSWKARAAAHHAEATTTSVPGERTPAGGPASPTHDHTPSTTEN